MTKIFKKKMITKKKESRRTISKRKVEEKKSNKAEKTKNYQKNHILLKKDMGEIPLSTHISNALLILTILEKEIQIKSEEKERRKIFNIKKEYQENDSNKPYSILDKNMSEDFENFPKSNPNKIPFEELNNSLANLQNAKNIFNIYR